MDLDTMLTEAAPARHLPLDGPDSPAAARLYQQITAEPPARWASRRSRFALPALIAAAAAAAAAAVVLALMPGSPAARAHHAGQGGTTLAAWTVIKLQHGVLRVTIRELRNPAGLWSLLRADGVPANVQFLKHNFMPTTSTRDLPKGCLNPRMSDQANAELQARSCLSTRCRWGCRREHPSVGHPTRNRPLPEGMGGEPRHTVRRRPQPPDRPGPGHRPVHWLDPGSSSTRVRTHEHA